MTMLGNRSKPFSAVLEEEDKGSAFGSKPKPAPARNDRYEWVDFDG